METMDEKCVQSTAEHVAVDISQIELPHTPPKTFKNMLQAKKRLQAFSSSRLGSPKKVDKKDENKEDKKLAKKSNVHVDVAKTVIEEIEEIKRGELEHQEQIKEVESIKMRQMESVEMSIGTQSRPKSGEKFKKLPRKPRNYRKRSKTPVKSSKTPPRPIIPLKNASNWSEFIKFNCVLIENPHKLSPKGQTSIVQQLSLQSPCLPIVPLKIRTADKSEKTAPFEFVRYTQATPSVAFSINFDVHKRYFFTKCVLNSFPKVNVEMMETLYNASISFGTDQNVKGRQSRYWYTKNWRYNTNECKILDESSSALSFIQSYSEIGDDEEEEELEISKKVVPKTDQSEKTNDDSKRRKRKKSRSDKEEEKKEKKKKKKSDPEKGKKHKRKKLETVSIAKKKKNISKKEKNLKVKKKRRNSKAKSEEKQVRKDAMNELREELCLIEEKIAKGRDSDKKKDEKIHNRKRKCSDATEDVSKKEKSKSKTPDRLESLKRLKMTEKSPEPVKKENPIRKTSVDVKKEDQKKESNKEHNPTKKKSVKRDPKLKDTEGDKTPDTDEYHSLWESEDDMSTSNNTQIKLLQQKTRSWESDEELFDRSKKVNIVETYSNLEIPLNLPRRLPSTNLDPETQLQLRLLEEERRNLDEERRKLEIEKAKILKLQQQKSISAEDVEPSASEFSFESVNSADNSNGNALENEYEEFIRAVSSESAANNLIDIVSSSSSSSDSEEESKRKRKSKRKKKKQRKKNIFDEFDIPVPGDLPDITNDAPLIDCIIESKSDPQENQSDVIFIEKTELEPSKVVQEPPKIIGIVIDRPEGNISKIVPKMVPSPVPVPSPLPGMLLNPLLDLDKVVNRQQQKESTVQNLDKEITKPISITLPAKKLLVDNSALNLDDDEEKEEQEQQQPQEELEKPKEVEHVIVEKKETCTENAVKKTESSKTETKKEETRTNKRRRSRSRERRRRSSPLPRRQRSRSPRRRSPPSRRRRRTPSPRRRSSPRRRRHSPQSARSSMRKRSLSPRYRRNCSPLNSPLDGFKRSVADSTISDDMLPQPPSADDYLESPIRGYGRRSKRSVSPNNPSPPRRISLDDRINQVLGLDHQHSPQSMANQSYYDYGHYDHKLLTAYNQQQSINVAMKPPPASKVVQVGNILQVVPNDDPISMDSKETAQKILQVGNMLQIVPGVLATAAPPPPPPPVPSSSAVAMETAAATKQSIINERRLEKEKRRQERERRRKDKEKKRKDREKKKEMKIKLKTERMIKKALELETDIAEGEEDEEVTENLSHSTPSVEIVSAPHVMKSILISGGSKTKKSVQFADGIRPGEGTSPSGGEELSSPPPQPTKKTIKLKDRRHKMQPQKKKKKIKVKVKRILNLDETGEEEEDDNLPPPSPPPGSPPPHVFPSRVKSHTVNNVHQFVIGTNPGAAAQFFRLPTVPPQILINRNQQTSHGYLPSAYHLGGLSTK